MVQAYAFHADYQPPANQSLPAAPFRLLEGGQFAPGQYCPVVKRELDQIRIHYYRWANERNRPIHHPGRAFLPIQALQANAATIACLPSQRLLIPANAYYLTTHQRRQAKVSLADHHTFCFAALGHTLVLPNGECQPSFSLLTTEAPQPLRSHHRFMPLIIPRQLEAAWLNPNTPIERIQQWLLRPQSLDLQLTPVQPLTEKDPSWSHLAA